MLIPWEMIFKQNCLSSASCLDKHQRGGEGSSLHVTGVPEDPSLLPPLLSQHPSLCASIFFFLPPSHIYWALTACLTTARNGLCSHGGWGSGGQGQTPSRWMVYRECLRAVLSAVSPRIPLSFYYPPPFPLVSPFFFPFFSSTVPLSFHFSLSFSFPSF